MGVPVEAAGGDGVIRGGEEPPRHVAGGVRRVGARPPPVRGAGLRQVLGVRGVGAWLRQGGGCVGYNDELVVAFSCKGRGVCRSCNAKRAHVTAVHRVEQVLPHVPYRQWTLSFPHRARWVLLKDVGLLSDVLTLFLRAVLALQRRRARRQGRQGGQPVGTMSFIQFFGSAL